MKPIKKNPAFEDSEQGKQVISKFGCTLISHPLNGDFEVLNLRQSGVSNYEYIDVCGFYLQPSR